MILINNEEMAFLKGLVQNKLLWVSILSLFFIHKVVNANKEVQQDLLHEYYDAIPADTIKEAEIYIPTKADSITEYAATLLGKDYTYGKTGPESFDCSGFIYFVYKKFDILMPRSSRFQAKQGEMLQREDIKKGDLLFFKSPSPNNPNIGHVGIVIENADGNIRFIHSSTGRGVVIDDLDSRHYSKRFIEARRVI